jgi:DNA-binding beta-propeller fold protein YncE
MALKPPLKARVLCPVLLATAALALFPAAAWAVGELSQKAGVDGCVSDNGSGGACRDVAALEGPDGVAVSADGRNVYVASEVSNSLGIFDRDPATGALTQKPGTAGCVSEGGSGGACEPGRGLLAASRVVVSPDRKNVYVASQGSSAIAIFDRDPATGALTQKPGTAGCVSQIGGVCEKVRALEAPRELAISPDGRDLYVAASGSDAVAVFERDAAGSLRQDAGASGCISETGTGGSCVDGKALASPDAVAVSPGGESVYVASAASNAVAVLRRGADGSLTQSGGVNGCISDSETTPAGDACKKSRGLTLPIAVVASADGRNVYVAGLLSHSLLTFERDSLTGELAQKPGAEGCVSEDGTGGACTDGKALLEPLSLAASPDGRNVYLPSSISNAVASFDRAADGGLLQRDGLDGCVSEGGSGGLCGSGKALKVPLVVAVSPDGRNVYVSGFASNAVAVFDRALPPPLDTVAPDVFGFRLAPRRFRVMPKRGSRFRFSLSETASVRIEIEIARVLSGRDMKRFRHRVTLDYPQRPAGANQIRFSGRLGKHPLRPGAYRATIVATDAAGNPSTPRRAGFVVLPPHRHRALKAPR